MLEATREAGASVRFVMDISYNEVTEIVFLAIKNRPMLGRQQSGSWRADDAPLPSPDRQRTLQPC
ncbi:hypothetical protein Tchl_2271 [Thauera chlorobenzoica]|uniref:Uncharacterized protein n=1 Tax=Thauera chlorobenzoica TaxID=96773 RepID=A0A1L6FDW8_9RHOO|nr:hypothetical protein Tchl_2271 [Thauera chlorobenzoica]